MNHLNDNGFFKLEDQELKKIKENFSAEKINDTDTLRIIKDFLLIMGSFRSSYCYCCWSIL